MNQKTKTRARWSSSIGFILASSGAAVGLGNIQRFPYITSQYGGAAFVLVYLFAILAVALPLMLVEFALGRHTQRTPVAAIDQIRPNSPWKYVGYLGIFTAFFILTYYSVVGGWSIAFFIGSATQNVPELHTFIAQPFSVLVFTTIFILICILIVERGVKEGIEKSSKVLMPLLFILLLILTVQSISLEGSEKGLSYYLYPDFSLITPKTVLMALSQAFFSLCIGEAVLVTYGSYASKKENLFASAGYIALFDTVVAIMSGFIIFPALFAFEMPVDQGLGLTFVVLPKVFSLMSFGTLFGALFFLLITFAALTTGVALLEIPVMFFIDKFGYSRRKLAWIVGLVALILSIPSALSKGGCEFFSTIELTSFNLKGVYEIMDFFWGGITMVVGGLLLTLFTTWVWGIDKASEELTHGCPYGTVLIKPWAILVRYIAPILIIGVLISLFI